MAIFVSGSDESSGKTGRDHFYLGGFIAREKDWDDFFAPAWQERVLEGPPAIPYLHMTDIRSRQWRDKYGLTRSAADHRVDEAFALIRTMGTLYPIGTYLDAGYFRDRTAKLKMVVSTGGAKAFEPDYICFLAYAVMVLDYLDKCHPEAEKVNFIVERKGDVTKHVQEFHSHMARHLEALGSPSLSRLVGALIPGDKALVPLQAADLLCWHSARSKSKDMDAASCRHYAAIAHNPGRLQELDRDLIKQLTHSLGV